MILKRVLFPQIGICNIENMYLRHNGGCILNDDRCAFSVGGILSTNTYFNSFSIGKWRKYTSVHDVKITMNFSGSFKLSLYRAEVINDYVVREKLGEYSVSSESKGTATFAFNTDTTNGIVYFELTSLREGSVWYGGYYFTDDEIPAQDIKLAVGICTFKRETFVKNNVSVLTEAFLDNPESDLYGKMELYISDNSQTLPEDLKTEKVHVFQNKNLGGAGGFTRAMLEILDDQPEKNYTHILLMDDDVVVQPEAFLLTYTFLQCLKPEYREAFIGGHMLKNDRRNIQSEAADHFDSLNHHAVKPDYNLEKEDWMIKNEIEDSVNYLSWWYCCMPVHAVSKDNLPLPLFIKRDDIEFGLRNGTIFITLNGICVWHEPFEYKTSAHLDYYYFRNLCILMAIHRPNVGKLQLIKFLLKFVGKALLSYRYKCVEFALWGIRDFLKGFDWFKAQDGEEINKALMKHNYQKLPIEMIPWAFQYGDYRKSLAYKEGNLKKLFRILTWNGFLLKAKKSVIVPSYRPHSGLFVRARRALNYEDATKSGFFTYKDGKALRVILKELIGTCTQIWFHYDSIKNEYAKRYRELTNVSFWDEYLHRSGEPVEFKSKLPLSGRPKSSRQEVLKLIRAWFMRGLQYILYFIPVKKNRVMIYNHDRKGFTCNPKYILKMLKEKYPGEYEIYWITEFPDSCKNKPEAENIRIIKANSKTHFIKYLRTRIYISNDCFPAWAIHTKKHKWINTWHGALSYKHIGYGYLAPMSTAKFKWFKLSNRQPDCFLSASECFTEDTSKSFRFEKSCFVESGFPRNDLFFHDKSEVQKKVREKLGINEDKKIVMFAPTFRRGMKSSLYGLELTMLCDALKKRFGGDWVVLFRNHNFVKKQRNINGVIDVSAYDDMNELLATADVLISDYSSCMYDFSLQFKPCFVYAPDFELYRKGDRDFTYPPEKWPYPIAKTNEELQNNILSFDEESWRQRLEEHFADTGSKDDGEAAVRVGEMIRAICK